MVNVRKTALSLMFAALTCGFTLQFEDLPRLVRENNKTVTGSERFSEAAAKRTGHLARSYLPTIESYVGGEKLQTGSYASKTEPYGGVEATINLFRGGKDLLESHIREAQQVGADSTAQNTFIKELADARKTYWRLVSVRESVSILRRALTQNEENLTVAKRRIARGLGTETDRLEFEIYRGQIEEEIESLTHGALLIEIDLAARVGMNQGTRIQTDALINHQHDEPLIAAAFDANEHPDLKSSRASQVGSVSLKSQKSRWWAPSLDLYGGYYLYTLRDRDYLAMRARDDTAVGVRLTVPLFDGLQSVTESRAASKQAQGYEEQSEQKERDLIAGAEVAKEDLKHAHELIHWAEDRIALGKKYLRQTLDEYGRGVKNSIDVLAAAQKYQLFERQYAERRRDYQIARADLLAFFNR